MAPVRPNCPSACHCCSTLVITAHTTRNGTSLSSSAASCLPNYHSSDTIAPLRPLPSQTASSTNCPPTSTSLSRPTSHHIATLPSRLSKPHPPPLGAPPSSPSPKALTTPISTTTRTRS